MRMSFGMCNSPSIYSELMQKVLQPFSKTECAVFIDDIILYSKDIPSHFNLLHRMFQALREAGLRLQPSKTDLFQSEILYLGHCISASGIKVPEYYSAVLNKWPIPETLKQLRMFMGKANYYRRFVPNFTRISSPLYDYLKVENEGKKDLGISRDKKALTAFSDIKKAICNAVTLTLPDFSKDSPFILDTDFSKLGIAAVLSQVQNGIERPIAFAGKRLLPRQASYSSTKGELLAVTYGLQNFRYYLLNGKFLIRTDNNSLTHLKTMDAPKGMELRWQELLAQYDFDIVHRSGKTHTNADAISRADHTKRR